jgi:hypothetical protein
MSKKRKKEKMCEEFKKVKVTHRGKEYECLDVSSVNAVRSKKPPVDELDDTKEQGVHGIYYLKDGTIHLHTTHYLSHDYLNDVDPLFSQGKYDTYLLKNQLMIRYT